MSLLSSIPVFAVLDLDRSCRFYVEKFGFGVAHREGGFARVVRDDVELHLTELNDASWQTRPDFLTRPICSGAESFLPGTQMCRVQVNDVDALYAELAPRGVLHPRGELGDRPWGHRDFSVVDIDNNLIVFFERRVK